MWNNADWDLYVKSAKSNASAYQRMYREQEEEEERRKAEEANKKLIDDAIKSGQLNKDGSEKNLLDKIGDTAKAAPGAIWEGLTASYKRVGEGTAEVIGELTGKNQEIRDTYAKMQDDDMKYAKLAAERMNDESRSEEERERWRKLFKKYASDNSSYEMAQKYNQEQIEKTDPVKGAAAVGSIGLDIVTGGALKAGLLGSKVGTKGGKVIDAVNKVTNPTGLKQGLVSGATLGTGYGALGAVEDKGSDVTVGDIAGGAALGGVTGGVLGGAIGGIGAGFSKLRAAKNPQEVEQAVAEVVAETKAKQEAPKQLGAGYRDPSEIEADLQRVQNGEDESLFKYTDTAGNDVTSQVADFDKEIAARRAAMRDLQQQAEGINLNTGKADMPAQATGGGGKPTLNVGMNVGDKTTLTPRKIKNILKREFDVDVKKATTQVSDTEPTYIPELSRPLTEDELFRLSELTGQDAIAHHTGEVGMLAGPKAKDWGGEFNAEYYMDMDGSRFSSKVDPSEYTGDVMGRANAAEAVTRLEAEIQELTAQQQSAFEALGGVQKTLDNEAVKTKFSQLQEELQTSVAYQENVRSAINREAAQDIDVKALNREEADLKAGVVPDELLKPFATVKSAEDVRSMMRDVDPEDTKGFIAGANEIEQERMYLNNKMQELFTKERYKEAQASINQGYNDAMAAVQELPEPIRIEKSAEINEQVLRDYDEIDQQLEMDADAVSEVQARMEEMDRLEEAMISEARAVQLSDPELFRPVDNEAVAKRLQEIQYQKFLASEAPDPIVGKEILTKVTDEGGDIVEEAANNPAVAKAIDNQIETQGASILDNTGKTAGIGWLVGTPTKVLEKFGATGKQVSDILKGAVHKKEIMDGEFEYKMFQWGRLIKGKDSTEKVAKALDGDQDALKALTGPQKQAYDEIKQWFKDQADQLGLPEDSRIKDYLPHLFDGKDFDSIEKTLAQLRAGKIDGNDITPKQRQEMEDSLAGIDAQTLAYLSSKNTYVAKNGFLKKRRGAKDYSLDLEKILTAYHSAASSQIAYKPAIDEANKLTPALTKEQNAYVTAVFKSLQGETDTIIEKSIDGALQNLSAVTGKNFGGDGTTGRLSRGARSAIYNATIGANVGSAIRNTQQMVNVYTEVGASGVMEAAPRALAALKQNSPMREMLYRNGVLSNRQGSYLQGGAMPKFKDKGTKLLWGMFNTTETLNRATAFFAGYDRHLKKFPKDFAGAEKAGAELSQKTNFKFSAIDIPIAMQGDMAKNFLQMQTYNVQQTQFIANMLGEAGNVKKIFTKGEDGKFTMNLEPQMKLARFIGGNALFFGTVGAATGMNWQEAVPFLSDVKAGEAPRSPIYQILFGNGKGQAGMVDTIGSGVSSLFTGKWEDALDNADTLARGMARTLLPGGNQAVKTVEGAASATSGVSTTGSGITDTIDKGISAISGQNPNGNIRFAQGQDAWSKFKATVLGQYSTQEGRDWVDEGMKNVPVGMEINGMPANDYIKQLPRAAQEQYVTYYSTKSQAQDALKSQYGTRSSFKSDLVEQLRSGSINYMTFSQRLNEYNNAVAEQMSSYMQDNNRIPARLRDDMLNNMFIPVESQDSYEPRRKSMNALEEELEYTEDDYNW